MDLERRTATPRRQGLPAPARLVIGTLALFGAVTLVQWVLASVLTIVKFGLLVVVVVGVGAWVIGAKGRR